MSASQEIYISPLLPVTLRIEPYNLVSGVEDKPCTTTEEQITRLTTSQINGFDNLYSNKEP